jgi:hypothetical protein
MLEPRATRGGDVEYVALIYTDEEAWEGLPPADREKVYARYMSLSEEMRAAGVARGGGELVTSPAATTVRLRDGQTLVTDGPYAEVKEALGGFFVLDCASLEEALDWAARIPAAETGAIEVRAVHLAEEAS